MGNQVSLVPKVSYEDIQMIVYRNSHVSNSSLLINTLPEKLQHCLIKTTVDFRVEEHVINNCLIKNPNIMIIVYGKNSNDITILHKYEQLVKLGFTNVHIYTGGIFEWMLLYEIYGKELFKITKYEIDILRYRPKSVLLADMITTRSNHLSMDGSKQFIENSVSRFPPDVSITIPMRYNGDGEGDGNGGGGDGGDYTSESGSGSGSGSGIMSSLKWLFGK